MIATGTTSGTTTETETGFVASKTPERTRTSAYQSTVPSSSHSTQAPATRTGAVLGNLVGESSFRMTIETQKAIEAVRFIAAHLKNEDDYAEVS